MRSVEQLIKDQDIGALPQKWGCIGERGDTMLTYAARVGSLQVVKHLLAQGIEVNETNGRGGTALHLAIQEGHLALAKWLTSLGTTRINLQLLSPPLHVAAMNGHLDIVKWLVFEQKVDINEVDQADITALTYACWDNQPKVVKFLLEQGADVNKGGNPLINVREVGILKLLLAHRADINRANKFEETPVRFAASRGDLDIVQCLYKFSQLTKPQQLQLPQQLPPPPAPTPTAALAGPVVVPVPVAPAPAPAGPAVAPAGVPAAAPAPAAAAPLAANAAAAQQPPQPPPTLGSEPLVNVLATAAVEGHLNVVQWLVEHTEVDPNAESYRGWTPLYFAAMYGHLSVLEYLLGRWDGKKCRGTTPLIVASTNGHLRVVEWLIQNKKVDPNETDASGSTALMLAARDGHLETVKWLAEREDVDVNAVRPWKGTAIAAACESGHLEVVQFLTTRCDMKQKLPGGVTLLHLAAQSGFLEMVQYLVEFFDAEAPNDAGFSALGCAVQSGCVPIAKWLLLEHNVKVNPANGAAYPLALAMQAGNIKFARWLIARGAKMNEHQLEPKTTLLRAMLVEEVGVVQVNVLKNFVNSTCADTIAQYVANWESAGPAVFIETPAA